MSDLSYVRNNDGTYSKLVQLSGSNVELITLANLVQIRDTNIRDYPGTGVSTASLDVKKFKDITIIVSNYHNVSLNINIHQQSIQLNNISNRTTRKIVNAEVIAAGATTIYTTKSLTTLSELFGFLRLEIWSTSAPTSGDLLIQVIGRY